MERPLSGRPPRLTLPPGAIDTQMHCYLPGFPAAPGAIPLPEGDVGPEAYRKLMAWLGISRVVVVQGNAHGADNANLCAVLEAFGEIARGVAVITPETPDAELERLHEAGIRGARIMDLPGGAVGLSALPEVAARAHAMGWTLNVQFDGSDIEAHEPALAAIPGRYVIDHHGKFFSGAAPGDARTAALLRLLDRGNAHLKLAGCYESSRAGAPDYADVSAVARLVVAHAPERAIWGTNWPHNLAKTPETYPDDAALTDLLLDWAPSETARQAILVDTPAALYGF
ncbi:amidohydrolase family protein [Albimonas pacifica]|uniref:D-galactarolactone isomerase n=1 Tax=Albimonas pacifica TaxID=1114924 RepID=A0A1I3NEA6_9RHOB|nr:amidohydrolase family protein [Albimonas pacifica]SFJ07678.1 D-galactarolactone isomerase [Albimonas pacifica]